MTQEKPRWNRQLRITAFVLISLLVLILFFFLPGSNDKPEAPKEPEAIVHNSAMDASVKQVKYYLKANLNDADSYEPLEWGTVTELIGNDASYSVYHKYRATNAFGAKIIAEQNFFLDSLGNVIEVKDLR